MALNGAKYNKAKSKLFKAPVLKIFKKFGLSQFSINFTEIFKNKKRQKVESAYRYISRVLEIF